MYHVYNPYNHNRIQLESSSTHHFHAGISKIGFAVYYTSTVMNQTRKSDKTSKFMTNDIPSLFLLEMY